MPAPRKYSSEMRQRAVQMAFELREEAEEKIGTIARVPMTRSQMAFIRGVRGRVVMIRIPQPC